MKEINRTSFHNVCLNAINEPDPRQGSLLITQYLQENPKAIIQAQHVLRAIFSVSIEKAPTEHVPHMLKRHLYPTPKNATFLFLASGGGKELVSARKAYPQANFFAIDVRHDPSNTITAAVSNTTFWHANLLELEAEEIIEYLGKPPDVVVIRHPDVRENVWEYVLPEWADVAMNTNTQVLITNFSEDEQQEVEQFLDGLGFRIEKYVYELGPDSKAEAAKELRGYGIVTGHDRFITIIRQPRSHR